MFGLLLFKLDMVGLGPFYHGTNAKFDFKRDFDFAAGVGAIYMFAAGNIEGGKAYAKYVGNDFRQRQAYLYEIYLKPSAKIVDLTQWNEETQELAALLDSDEHFGRLAGGAESSFSNKDRWLSFAHCDDRGGTMPCVFDVLDYNDDLMDAFRELGIDGLYFVDGLDEINDQVEGSNHPTVALFNTDVIDKVSVYEVETRGDGIEKISEGRLQRLVEAMVREVLAEASGGNWRTQIFSDDTGEYRIGDIMDYIEKADIPLTAFPVDSLTDINLAASPEETGDQVPGSPEFVARAKHSDLSYPIIVVEYSDGRFIADGVHRLWKAYDTGMKKIKGYLITAEELASNVKPV